MTTSETQEKTAILLYRERAKLSQRALARIAGIDRLALRLWEKTGKEPFITPTQMRKLLEALDCKIEDITPFLEVA